MYLEEIVEVALGLVFVYVVMSLAVMQIQEWLSGVLKARAKYLEEALRVMLAETLQKKTDQTRIPMSLIPKWTGAHFYPDLAQMSAVERMSLVWQ